MPRNADDVDLFTEVDDELFDALTDLTGQRVVHIAIWDDSLADELADLDDEDAPDSIDRSGVDSDDDGSSQEVFDLDLYLADGIYFELYGTLCFPDLDADPLRGVDVVNKHLASLVNQGIWFDEVAVDEEDQLVLVIAQSRQPILYFVVGGWLIEEWDELPTG